MKSRFFTATLCRTASTTIATAAIFLAATALTTLPSCTGRHTVRLVSYNIDGGIGTDSLFDIDRTARTIAAEEPDVVAVQGAAPLHMSGLPDSPSASVTPPLLDALASATGMHATEGISGVGILSREEPLASQIIPLEGHMQGLLIVEFDDYYFASIAMSPLLDDRMMAAARLKEEAAKVKKPFFFGGSLSARYGSPTVVDLVRDFTPLVDLDARTYPASKPVMLMDYLFMYNRNLREFDIFVFPPETPPADEPAASTHLPVVAEVSFR